MGWHPTRLQHLVPLRNQENSEINYHCHRHTTSHTHTHTHYILYTSGGMSIYFVVYIYIYIIITRMGAREMLHVLSRDAA